jgi:hypothetical protein
LADLVDAHPEEFRQALKGEAVFTALEARSLLPGSIPAVGDRADVIRASTSARHLRAPKAP